MAASSSCCIHSRCCRGLVSLSMLLAHGACWAAYKADHVVAERAARIARWATLAYALFYVVAGIWLAYGMPGYAIVGPVVTDGASNPLYKEVARGSSWFASYMQHPWFWVAPVLAWLARDRCAAQRRQSAGWPASLPAA